MLEIQKYIIANGVEKAITNFSLKTKIYDTKILFKYDQLSSPAIMNKIEVQECRGLVLEKNTWKVLNMGLTKFFNAGETNAHKIDWDSSRILEKLDGSCIQVYFDTTKNTWFAATTGTAEGEGYVNNSTELTFNDLFWNTLKNEYNLDQTHFIKGYTYVFELTTPYNIVVTPHTKSEITFITIRNLQTLKELSFNEVIDVANKLGLPYVKQYNITNKNIQFLQRSLDNVSWCDEGYVVVDNDFNRIKIKNPAYVAVHHTKNKTAEHHILEIVKSNEIEEYIATFPTRKEELLLLKTKYYNLILILISVWDNLQQYKAKNITSDERKKFATKVFNICKDYNINEFTGLFFALADGKYSSIPEYIRNFDNKKLYIILKNGDKD